MHKEAPSTPIISKQYNVSKENSHVDGFNPESMLIVPGSASISQNDKNLNMGTKT